MRVENLGADELLALSPDYLEERNPLLLHSPKLQRQSILRY